MNYSKTYSNQISKFIAVCGKLSANKYVTGHGGNLAWKLEEDLILITPTQINKGEIGIEDLVFINMKGDVLEGSRKSTGETPMYLNFFRERPDIVTVVHCHPPVTGAFAISKEKNWLMRPLFPETTSEVGPVPVVPYGEPLTQKLADNFLPYLKKYNAFLMENHGLVIMSSKDITWTYMLTELLEMTSVTIVHALSFGGIKEIPREDVRNLSNTMKVRNLPLFGLPGENKDLESLYFAD